jgi:phage-related protein
VEPPIKRLPAAFYTSSSGAEPVREWIRGLSLEDRKSVGKAIKTVEYGWPIGMPTCRAMSSHRGLWEVRANLTNGGIARILFRTSDGRMVLLHGFVKKTQKTPQADIDLAVKRMKEVGQ